MDVTLESVREQIPSIGSLGIRLKSSLLSIPLSCSLHNSSPSLHYYPPPPLILVKCICRNLNCAQEKQSLHSRWNFFSTITEFTWPWRWTLTTGSDVKCVFQRCRQWRDDVTHLESVHEKQQQRSLRDQQRHFGGKSAQRRLGRQVLDGLENLGKFYAKTFVENTLSDVITAQCWTP